jgi:hypothetical protein
VSGAVSGQRHWWADPARHAYRAADAERPEDGCASCGYLAEMHPNKAPATGQTEVSDALARVLAAERRRAAEREQALVDGIEAMAAEFAQFGRVAWDSQHIARRLRALLAAHTAGGAS